MKIIYTHKALDDLKRLHKFISNENPKAAVDASKRLLNAIYRLIDFPLLGKKIKGTHSNESFRDLVTGNYVIRYVVLKKEIHILNIWHGKEQR